MAANATDASYLVLPSQARLYTNPTVVRVRGLWNGFPASAVNVGGAVGIIAWSDRDDTVPTDPPRPFQDPDLDWMWHHYWYGFAGVPTTDSFIELEIDSKAMRKLGADQGVLFVLENGAVSAGSISHAFAARCLIKE